MRVTINGNKHTFERPLTISEVLTMLQIAQDKGVAVARNYSVVSKTMLNQTYLDDGDNLDIITATAGG